MAGIEASKGIDAGKGRAPNQDRNALELSLADTAPFRALADIAGFDPYNSMERVARKQSRVREPWKAMPR